MRPLALFPLALVVLVSCRDEAHPAPVVAVEPPVASPDAIPDAPVSGRIHGVPFVLRDARYVVDRRPGYAHTDLELSSGAAESPCAQVSPRTATSIWLRLDGPDRIEPASTRIGPPAAGEPDAGSVRWQVHYQVFEDDAWRGVGEGSALLTLHAPAPDGHVSGGIAVCFPDDARSCVSGSFEAVACPPRIDQPVRGTPPPEAIPPGYLQRVMDAGRP